MAGILIINDSPSINFMLKNRLESAGFFVDTVESGEGGIEKAKERPYQLILIDYNLPGINGREVCQILRKGENTKSIPIVFMSSMDRNKIGKISAEAGADGCIDLSFEGKELVNKVKEFIEK